jgi:hypothetical protein
MVAEWGRLPTLLRFFAPRGDCNPCTSLARRVSGCGTSWTCQPPYLMFAYGGTSRHNAPVNFGFVQPIERKLTALQGRFAVARWICSLGR